jgi:hypothetical protein
VFSHKAGVVFCRFATILRRKPFGETMKRSCESQKPTMSEKLIIIFAAILAAKFFRYDFWKKAQKKRNSKQNLPYLFQ